jgi:hypothetical protein
MDMAERSQQFGTLYGDLHRKNPFTNTRVAKVAWRGALGKGVTPAETAFSLSFACLLMWLRTRCGARSHTGLLSIGPILKDWLAGARARLRAKRRKNWIGGLIGSLRPLNPDVDLFNVSLKRQS